MAGSCEEVIFYGDLEVLITGTLSGNPRSDIGVTLYLTKANAEDQVNAIGYTEFTDADGYAIFYDLEAGVRYWVRSDVVLVYIKRTQTLKEGYNLFDFTVL